jgi:AhpD family alkylhydroperoxidase
MTRPDPNITAPDQMKLMIDYAVASGKDSVEPSLAHLVKIRASQINGCALCLHMHAHEARKDGDSDDRIILLDAWREAGVFSEREQAALIWTEALTRLNHHDLDAAYDRVTAQFTDVEVVKLTVLINTINSFNRLGVAFQRAPMGRVQPRVQGRAA